MSDLSPDLREAAHFATYFTASPASLSTAHLYIFSLTTWPSDSALSQMWKTQFPRIPSFKRTTGKGDLDVPLMTIRSPSEVYSVTLSGGGTHVVSCSLDSSVRVWDASTGAELKTEWSH